MSVFVPTDLDRALAALDREPDALVLAGGTDVMVAVNVGSLRFDSVVALRAIDELKQVEVDADRGLVRIGAGVTYTRLLAGDVVSTVPALAQAARTVGSPQIRNAGTIGGNLATASPAGDTLPVLVALDARVEIASVAGRRTVPVQELLTGPKRTSLRPGELITAVLVPIVRGHQEYRKVGVRNAMVIAVASVAAVVDLDHRSVAIGLGSVGPVPLRAPDAEAWMAGRLGWRDDGVALDERADLDQFAALVAAAAATDRRPPGLGGLSPPRGRGDGRPLPPECPAWGGLNCPQRRTGASRLNTHHEGTEPAIRPPLRWAHRPIHLGPSSDVRTTPMRRSGPEARQRKQRPRISAHTHALRARNAPSPCPPLPSRGLPPSC